MKNLFKISCLMLIGLTTMENLQAQDWANLNRYKAANEALKSQESDENRVVFMGNSITEGWGNQENGIFKNKSYINRGISGQTTPQMLIRFRPDVIELNPKVVVFLAGINDIAGNTGPSTIEMICHNIFSMVEIAQANDIKVIICSTLPAYDFPWRPGMEPAEKVIELNKHLKAFAEKKGCYYVDYFSAMADERNGLPPKYASDEVHPTAEGYAVMEPLVEAAIKAALEE